jgi:hypothetical protein
MDPQLVIPLNATDHASSGWPRILRIVAAMSLIFAIVTTVNAGFALHSILNQGSLGRASYNSEAHKYQASRALLAAARIGIGAVMLAVAFRFWHRGRWHRVLMITARLWLAIWFLGLILPLYLYRGQFLEYISVTGIRAIIPATFPLMVVLTLHEYSKTHRQPLGSSKLASATPPTRHTQSAAH